MTMRSAATTKRVAAFALAALPFLSFLGCDASKAELDRTKQTVASLTAERDSLKTQLDQANQRNSQLQQQLTDLQSKAQAQAAAPPAAEPEPAAPVKGKRATTSKRPMGEPSGPAAETPPARTPEEQKKVEQIDKKANTGGGHF